MDKHILLVEDDPADEALILRVLRKHKIANEIVVILTSSKEEENRVMGYLSGNVP